jgi:hypothetical protein
VRCESSSKPCFIGDTPLAQRWELNFIDPFFVTHALLFEQYNFQHQFHCPVSECVSRFGALEIKPPLAPCLRPRVTWEAQRNIFCCALEIDLRNANAHINLGMLLRAKRVMWSAQRSASAVHSDPPKELKRAQQPRFDKRCRAEWIRYAVSDWDLERGPKSLVDHGL